jgi:hypothetical protein
VRAHVGHHWDGSRLTWTHAQADATTEWLARVEHRLAGQPSELLAHVATALAVVQAEPELLDRLLEVYRRASLATPSRSRMRRQ